MSLPQRRTSSRIELLLDAAAAHFARQGYADTTIREIAAGCSMLPGSVYYHFPSKEQLLLAVYREGVDRLRESVDGALAGAGADPWQRLERALVAHLETVLGQGDYARVLIRVLPDDLPGIADELRTLRRDYEARFETAVAALALPPDVDRGLLRLMLLGAANWAEVWYRPGGSSPAAIAARFIGMLRRPLDHEEPRR